MALRLTSTPIASGPPGFSELSAEAALLLGAGEIDRYRDLFARVQEDEDRDRRYRSRTLLIEEGLRAAPQTAASRSATIYFAIANAAIDALAEEPREPVLLNFAGVALYELWSLDAARALFTAALRLDPALPHVRRNLTELVRRKKAARGGQRKRVLDAALPALARRAKQIARQAEPAKGLTLSLCMIVRDEEEMLPRCLAAAAPAVDEIVIVDTGSTDRTIEIARSFGARVIEREWTGSFSDARNVSFDAATGDWIMYLDADEVIVAEDVEQVRALTGRTWREAFYLTETNFTGHIGDGTGLTFNALRVFRNRPQYRFEGRLHEQIGHTLPGNTPERLEHTPIRVEHYGYLGVVRNAKEKSKRNIELLKAQQAESPPTAFLHFNLGSEYAAAGDAPAALKEFESAWEMVLSDPEGRLLQFIPTLLLRLTKALRFCDRPADAIARADDGLRRYPGFTDLVFEQAMSAQLLHREAEAVAYFKRCIELGDAPSQYSATLGCGTYLPRLALAELHLSKGEAAEALPLFDWCLREHPNFFGTILPYATALLRTGTDPQDVVEQFEQRVDDLTPTFRFMLGTALFENGAAAPAERQFRLLLERQPHNAQARVAYGETLLYQRRYQDAAAAAAALSDDSPLACNALRTELFARIVGGDIGGAQDAHARASRTDMTAEELNLFAGWIALADGQEPRRSLPGAAAPMLAVILEALLRVQELKAFEVLVPLLEHSQLPRREQRELLADMYLRRGFLASAAKEWMAVCADGADARAMIGLARVASVHGLPEDAVNFASEAVRLEPANPTAIDILERVTQLAAA